MADAETETSPAPTAKKQVFETVTLAQPIIRGDKEITQLQLRKPKAGELRGLSMGDVVGMDVTALIKLTPRISDPVLTEAEVADLDADDFTEIAGTIRGFFMTKGEVMVMEAMMAEHQPKT